MKKHKYFSGSVTGNNLEATANAVIVSNVQYGADLGDLRDLCVEIIKSIDERPWDPDKQEQQES